MIGLTQRTATDQHEAARHMLEVYRALGRPAPDWVSDLAAENY